jgi:hypothetical protein
MMSLLFWIGVMAAIWGFYQLAYGGSYDGLGKHNAWYMDVPVIR